MQFHIDQRTAENIRNGMPPEEAQREAERRFGHRTQIREQGYEVRGGGWIESMLKDLNYGLRVLRKSPAFTLTAVLTLALGIGATTAMFSVVNAVLLRPLPYRQPERLVAINEYNTDHPIPELPEGSLSYPDYSDIVARNHTFESVALYTFDDFTLTGLGEPLHVEAEHVTPNLFHVLGVQPALGRAFLPNEDEPGHHVAIVSDRFWRAHMNGDRSAINRSIALNGSSFTIVGVMPPGFQFAVRSKPRDLWLTFSRWTESGDSKDPAVTQQRGFHGMFAIGRLKPGVTLAQADGDLQSVAHALAVEYPKDNSHVGIAARPELLYVLGSTRKPLLVLMGAVGLVLLIACANVANLLLARGRSRMREIAIRSALGATRARIIRQLVTESVVLAIAGAAVGTAFASFAVAGLLKLYPENLPRAAEIGIDARVLLFTVALAIVTGIVFGLLPASRISAPDLNETMLESGRTSTATSAHSRFRSMVVVAQTALGVMLLIGAGLLIRSLERLSHADLGLEPSHVLTADFNLSETRYKGDKIDSFVTELLNRVRALPGVTSAAGAMPLPLGGDDGWNVDFNFVENPVPKNDEPSAGFYDVTPGFFETMKIPLLRGRFFDQRDQRNSDPVMIINEALAKKYFPDRDPVGRKIKIGAGEGAARERYKTREIVGVVGDVRTSNLTQSPLPAYYIPTSQLIWGAPTLVVRTAGDPREISPVIAKVLQSMDAEAPLFNVRTMEDCLALDRGRARFQTVLLSLFAGIALLLTAIGLYGTIAYSVAQRTHEIGVRLALGASRANVLSMMLHYGMQLTVLGLVIGVAGALALAKIIAAMLYETPPRDPATYFVVCVTLSIVALLASYLPALRASKVDPLVALRYE
jgi:putative ABC transport system permease protein